MLSLGLFRRHVLGSAYERASLSHSTARFHTSGDPEIHHRNLPLLIQHDVLGLKVAVNHSFCMRNLESLADLHDDLFGFLRCEFSLFADYAL